jgi:hypothetical protein
MEERIGYSQNKDKIAIVVVGYNRIESISRLLGSLLDANYKGDDIPLVISIDCSGDKLLYEYVHEFNWVYGNKYVIIQETRLGLKDHIFKCGDLTKYFNAIILLEDDIYVSPDFYNYVCVSLENYKNDDRIAGISLYSADFNGFVGFPFLPMENGSDVYAAQTVVSWGECWNERMWNSFRNWMDNEEIKFGYIDMPECIKHWEKAWSKFFYAYILSNDKYFIIPYKSLATNFSEEGEHSSTNNCIYQVNLLMGTKKYDLRPFDELIKYDVYGNNMEIYQNLGIMNDDLCVDLYGNNYNFKNKKFVLSNRNLPYKKIKQYALRLRPQELNVIKNIKGNDIFLFDTTIFIKKTNRWNSNIIRYHLKGFNVKSILKFALVEFFTNVKRSIGG